MVLFFILVKISNKIKYYNETFYFIMSVLFQRNPFFLTCCKVQLRVIVNHLKYMPCFKLLFLLKTTQFTNTKKLIMIQ